MQILSCVKLFLLFICLAFFCKNAMSQLDSKNIIGRWLCIDEGPNYTEFNLTEYHQASFHSVSHTVLLKNSDGAVIETKTTMDGTWSLQSNELHQKVNLMKVESLNQAANPFISMFQKDADNTHSVIFSIYEFQSNRLSFWTEREGLIHCMRK